jgi:hypothetical protein
MAPRTTTVWSANISSGVSTQRSHRNILPSAEISNPGWTVKQIRVCFTCAQFSAWDITGASIGLRSGTSEDYQVDKFVRLLFSGNNGVSIPLGTTLWSDWVDYPYFDETVDHLCHMDTGTLASIKYGSGGDSYRKSGALSDAMVADISGYSTASYYYGIQEIQVLEDEPIIGVLLKYRTGATSALCEAATYQEYTTPFDSEGFVNLRVEG